MSAKSLLTVSGFFHRRAKIVLLGSAVLALAMIGVKPAAGQRTIQPVRGFPHDWSHQHLVFSPPSTPQQALQLQQDPRFWHQRLHFDRRQSGTSAPAGSVVADLVPPSASRLPPISLDELQKMSKRQKGSGGLWYESLARGGGESMPLNYPAKYTLEPVDPATPACSDYVAFNASNLAANASQMGTFSADPATGGQTVTIQAFGITLVLTSSTTVNTGTSFQVGVGIPNDTANLAAAINRNGGPVGVTATASSPNVTVTAIMPGHTGNEIGLMQTVTGFSWSKNNLAGGGGGSTSGVIVAYDNLYAGTCSAPNPNLLWAYDTTDGTANTTISSSPVISADGSQLAFIQNDNSNSASLIVLKWKSMQGTVATPVQPDMVTSTPGTYQTCRAGATSCELLIALKKGNSVTASSPFYDYSATSDTLYIGDDGGVLHKFTGVFSGTPAESAAGNWPLQVNAVNPVRLTSPVLDDTSGRILVGDAGGFLYTVTTSGGGSPAATQSAQLAAGTGIVDAPIVDSTTGKVYVFVANDNTTGCGGSPCNAVYQLSTTFGAGKNGTEESLGAAGSLNATIYDGSFDNTFYSNPGTTGKLYVCGSNAGIPTLYAIKLNGNFNGNLLTGPALGTAANCSPIAEILAADGTTDWIFLSVTGGGTIVPTTNVCTGACVYSFAVNGLSLSTGTTPANGIASAGGSSGIVVDNNSSAAGASQIYFSFLSDATAAIPCATSGSSPKNVGCAVQAAQASLR